MVGHAEVGVDMKPGSNVVNCEFVSHNTCAGWAYLDDNNKVKVLTMKACLHPSGLAMMTTMIMMVLMMMM